MQKMAETIDRKLSRKLSKILDFAGFFPGEDGLVVACDGFLRDEVALVFHQAESHFARDLLLLLRLGIEGEGLERKSK